MKIQINHVTKHFGSLTALSDISLDVRQGEFLTITGPGGCGKSTLLDLITGLLEPSSGEILLDGRPVRGPGLARGVVFQQHALFPWRTALANVEFGLEAKAVPFRDRAELARHYLDLVGLAAFDGRYPHELSGGMRQRVAIARSLAFDPDVLLMDEPFAALDTRTRRSLRDELLAIWERTGKTFVFATRSLDEAAYLGRRVAVMTSSPGRVIELREVQEYRGLGEFRELREDRELRKPRDHGEFGEPSEFAEPRDHGQPGDFGEPRGHGRPQGVVSVA